MTTLLFWIAIPIGFSGLPVSLAGYVLLPFGIVSLFNEFAAPRIALLSLFGIVIITSLPPASIICQRAWLLLFPREESPKHAMLLGSQAVASAVSVAYLLGNGWIDTPKSTWLLTAYWFLCLVQLWGVFFMLLTDWLDAKRTNK
jgi:hypothetical protein